jgi:DNA repair exonuclease SbcCD ATPase subunit
LTDARLAFLRELERADRQVGAVLAELDELADATNELRRRSLRLEALLARLPAEQERAAAATAEAEELVAAAGTTLARAVEELAAAERGRNAERLATARRFEVRARDSLRTAERRLADAVAERERLAEEWSSAERETSALEGRASELAAELAGRPRLAEDAGRTPGEGLDGVIEWSTTARAALLVARGGLAGERDAVIRQANELGALVLGEPVAAASAAVVARRVERELRP